MSEQNNGISDPHLVQYEKGVFVSYAWGGKSEEIVSQIEQVLQTRGIKVIRDKRNLGYKDSIRQFMERIGRGSCVIVVISDEYLRSQHCMFELVEIAAGKQFHDRIFPVVLDDANIYDPVKRIEYVRYWEIKQTELADAMRTVAPANLQGIREEIDLYDRIRKEIAGLTSTLKDMNTFTPEMHKQHDYTVLVDAIAERTPSNDQLQREKILDRRLDAAMPTTTDSNELLETPNESQSDHNDIHSELPKPKKKLAIEMKVAIVGAFAIIVAAFIGIGPAVFDQFINTFVNASPTPACVSADDILVRLHVWRGEQKIATLAPSDKITLEPDLTVDLRVEIISVSDEQLPTIECAWNNANSTNTNSATEGRLLHSAGCNVDYQSGHIKIVDSLSLQLSQSSCPDLLSYAFFIFPK